MGPPSPLELPGFRAYPLDGAMLWFHARLGLNLRWDAAATRKLRRRAPRVLLFAITNRCNEYRTSNTRHRILFRSQVLFGQAFRTAADR